MLFQNWAKVVFLYFGDPMRSIKLDSQAGGVLGCHWGMTRLQLSIVLKKDEDAEEMPVGAGEHDGAHAANDREVNDEDAAESLLTHPLNPGEWPRPEPNEIEEKIGDLEDRDTDQPNE